MPEWLTMKELLITKKYPMNMKELKKLLDKRMSNGLVKYIDKLGRCLVIKRVDFEKWLQEQGE